MAKAVLVQLQLANLVLLLAKRSVYAKRAALYILVLEVPEAPEHSLLQRFGVTNTNWNDRTKMAPPTSWLQSRTRNTQTAEGEDEGEE
jgi:hypothetical protein